MVLPHSPYVFGANGEPISEEESSTARGNKHFVNQLIFTNKKVKVLVDEILSKSKNPPIIILQADHGQGDSKPARMRILNAYYLPQGGNAVLYDSISPVNAFRIVFNLYFGTNYELLYDQSYFSWWTGTNKPYNFINVTDEVKYKCEDEK